MYRTGGRCRVVAHNALQCESIAEPPPGVRIIHAKCYYLQHADGWGTIPSWFSHLGSNAERYYRSNIATYPYMLEAVIVLLRMGRQESDIRGAAPKVFNAQPLSAWLSLTCAVHAEDWGQALAATGELSSMGFHDSPIVLKAKGQANVSPLQWQSL